MYKRQELRRWNRRVSLVGPIDAESVVERHYGESLEGLRLLGRESGVLVDVGSGAGFPGFVLAVARPGLEVTLVEARQRKWSFLQAVCRRTGLVCHCLNARVEATLVDGLPPEIDWVTTRAVGVRDLGLPVLVPRLSPGGALLLWSGTEDPELPSPLAVRRQVPLPGAQHRRILEISPESGQVKEQ